VCGKVADLLSDPALDTPTSESAKEKQELADQIAQMSMKVHTCFLFALCDHVYMMSYFD